MTKIFLTIGVLVLSIGINFAGISDEKPGYIKKGHTIPKGPDYKNRQSEIHFNRQGRAVFHGMDDSKKGADFKNRRNYSVNLEKVVVKSSELKGPDFKNRRF